MMTSFVLYIIRLFSIMILTMFGIKLFSILKEKLMARVIVITSGKGGVGKTTISAYLGMELAKNNKRVCLVDMDIGLNNLDVVLGVENRFLYTLMDVVNGKCRLRQALVEHSIYPLLFVLSSGNAVQNLSVRLEDLYNIVDELKRTFDFVLIDCPAGIDAGFNRAVSVAEEALIVTTPHLSSLRDADKVVTILNSYNLSSIRFVVNRCRGDLIKDKLMLDVYDISKALNIEFGGVIPEDDSITLASNFSKVKIDYSYPCFRAINVLADNIITGGKKLFDCTYKYKGLLGGIKKMLRRKI